MSLKRETLRHSAIYSLANVLGKLAGFIMLPFYAHIFEAEGYGVIAMIDASVGFLSVALATGSYNAILKIYHEEPVFRKPLVIGTGIWTVWGLSLLCIPLPVFTSPWISLLLIGDATHWPLIVLALATFVVDMGGYSASTFLVIRQRSVLYSCVNLLQLLIGLALNIILVVYLQVGLIGIFISSLISAAVASMIFHGAAIWEYGLRYDKEIGRKLRKFWFPLIPGELIWYVSRQAERYLARFLISLEGVGILEMAYKFPPLINIFVSQPFMRTWGTKSLEIGPRAGAPEEIGSMFTLYMFLTLFAAVFMATNIDTVLKILTPPEFWLAAEIARIEIVTTVIAAANTYLVFGLLYSKQTHIITRIRVVTAVVKIGLSAGLIATAGLAGAAYSALIMGATVLIWSFSKAQRAYQLPIEYWKIAVLSISAVAVVAVVDHVPQLAGGLLNQLQALLFDNVIAFFASTPLGTWQSGRLLELFSEYAHDLTILLVNCCLSLLYGTLILVVKPELVNLEKIFMLWRVIQAKYYRKA